MKDKIYLSVLGGGQEIGASCLFLDINGDCILLDCGKGTRNGVIFGPDFTPLLEHNRSPGDIQNVFISHAHFDHIGFITELRKLCGSVPIYATKFTTELAKSLLWDNLDNRKVKYNAVQLDDYFRNFESSVATIEKTDFLKKIDFGKYAVTFYEAGHIPGAAMISIDTGNTKILYTGDFSVNRSMLTDGNILPENYKADVIIIDGTFAKKPGCYHSSMFDGSLSFLRNNHKHPIAIRVSQLTKGIEMICAINQKAEDNLQKVKIYIDEKIWNVAQAFMNVGIPILKENCFLYNKRKMDYRENAIYVTTERIPGICEYYPDYSLHAGFDDLKLFINKYATDRVFVVHSPSAKVLSGTYSLEKSCKENLYFVYPETGETYLL